jgi:putative DNA primase/helicase
MIPEALQALKAHRQFILYRSDPSKTRRGRTEKIPCDYRTGKPASALDAEIWLDADTAISFATTRGAPFAAGFVLTPDCKRFCLDIDNCLQADGEWSPLAHQLCAMFPGAAIEVSQSGRGLHIWGTYTGEMPAHACKNVALGIELYTEGRFIALGSPESALQQVIATYFPPAPAQVADQEWTDAPRAEWAGPADDDDLIQLALNSRSPAAVFGARASFADLWRANEEALGRAYPADGRPYDASSADAALAQHLAFWTGADAERIRRLMLRSALVRDKWERQDYLRRTILGAVARQVDVYKAPPTLALATTAQSSGVTLNGIEMSFLQVGTQDSVAQIFASKMAGKMLFNHTRNAWFEWDGTRWRIERTERALDFARELARTVNYEGKSSMGTASFCAGVEHLARADRRLAVEGSEFDRDNYLLNTPGGTFDLRTNTPRPHAPEDHITMCTAVIPSPDGGAAFNKFLAEITQDNQELVEFLQISLGACLSGAVESHWMAFWIGTGRNGKNTLGDLVQDAMGDYARKVPTSTLMAKTYEGHPTEIANLQGIRLAVSSEINDGEHWNEARINEITGDATLPARFMRGDFFTFTRTHKHLVYGNHRPQLRGVTDALKSRLLIVPFKVSFLGREDPELPSRLRECLPYVLAWLIEGHCKWMAAGKKIPQCQAVEAESADYFAAQSTVDMWLSERVPILSTDNRPSSQLPKSSDLYRDYANWKKDRGESPVSQTRWAETMRRFKKEVSNGVRYRGLMLIAHGGDAPFALLRN